MIISQRVKAIFTVNTRRGDSELCIEVCETLGVCQTDPTTYVTCNADARDMRRHGSGIIIFRVVTSPNQG